MGKKCFCYHDVAKYQYLKMFFTAIFGLLTPCIILKFLDWTDMLVFFKEIRLN